MTTHKRYDYRDRHDRVTGDDAQTRRLNAQIAMIRRARDRGFHISETEANLAGLQYKPLDTKP
ncbi:Uncharacterised protein [Mycobacteroides abscessus subsp. bolletii]|nr:Uncharacterised protein [Mycobacteroides abscessus subsp. bolletii]SKS03108.1 Uncharacterised protein [Mycobacteroides abscessus subsp. bolletii]DAZ90106.1 TPA_asm: hypothetical protein PROPHIFVLQ01-1_19 [Mycobacterium phage prophiFVLQ01-1]